MQERDEPPLNALIRRVVTRVVRERLEAVGARSLADLVRGYRLVARLTLDDGGMTARLSFLLQADDDPSLVIQPSLPDAWWRPVRFVHGNQSSVVSVVRQIQRAGRAFSPLAEVNRSADPLSVELSEDDFVDLFSSGARKLARRGVILQLPAELTVEGRARLRATLRVGRDDDEEPLPGWGMGAAATEPFRWRLALGDTDLSADEFRLIAAVKREVVRVRGRWIAVDPGEVAEVLRTLESDLDGGTIPAAQASGLALAQSLPVTKAVAARIEARGRVAETATRARQLRTVRELAEPHGFAGELRPYQRRGLAWLVHLEEAGVGGVLADDMGLGKTVQIIALLLERSPDTDVGAPTLIVSPASVLPNWEREIYRFAPDLHVVRHHGSTRSRSAEQLRSRTGSNGIVLTTYGTLRSSRQLLSRLNWNRVILDEAQNIKNPTAAQTKAALSLRTRHRLALTGTPVENRLDDLWSIMQFTNPGLLGPRTSFRERFAAPVERGDTDAADRLRRMTRPFVLRRTKHDPDIAPDLPPKVEADVMCELSQEQATLYQAALDHALDELDGLDGIRRRARILTLLTELKQICDHPALYLHETGPLAERSGKLERLGEMLDEITSEDDAALVFTQYAEMGRLLINHLTDHLDIDVPFLHGGLALRDRQELVDLFQHPTGPPVLLVSLRAGGVGLNLTRASHVIHFDRWWNPAVEDQATDRAHRIGQEQTVFVHRFAVAGTIEERIADLIDRKRSIAGQVIQAGEGWLTELPTDELRSLLELR